MPVALPEIVDPWRMVLARRIFSGTLTIEMLPRLREALADGVGEVKYAVEFGADEYDIAYLDLRVEAGLPLVCQRTLKPFVLPVTLAQRLGLIRDEADEAGLPEMYEPLLVTDAQLRVRDVIEDELILALPVVALGPGAPIEDLPLAGIPEIEVQKDNPFAVLGQLKSSRH